MKITSDVIVIRTGPADSSTALEIAKAEKTKYNKINKLFYTFETCISHL